MEIERKFLVRGDFMPEVTESVHIVQGYLSTNTNKIVRVRIRGNKGYLTIKGKPKGISRFEWEEEIPLEQAMQMYSDVNYLESRAESSTRSLLKMESDPYEACKDAHAVAIVTEWTEFKDYDWKRIYLFKTLNCLINCL